MMAMAGKAGRALSLLSEGGERFGCSGVLVLRAFGKGTNRGDGIVVVYEGVVLYTFISR